MSLSRPNYNKIYAPLILLTVLVFVIILLNNNVFAQSLHERTLYEIVKQTSESDNTDVIDVGDEPTAIAINQRTNTVYVANSGSNNVSVIDGLSNKVVAGVLLHINPFNSGSIECDGLLAPTSQYFYIGSNTTCIAKPNKGFEFLSWEEN